MKDIKIVETEVIDNTHRDENGEYCKSGVSVLVKVEFGGKELYLDFQTTTTQDYGAINSSLWPYDGTEDYDSFIEVCEKTDVDETEMIQKIKEESMAQELWQDFIDEKFITNDDHFGGMDANSEYDKMTLRED